MTNTDAWGWSAHLDCGNCDFDKITSESTIKEFLKVLVNRIDMKAYGEPIVAMFGEGDLYGYSAVQLIHTSCITVHFDQVNMATYLCVFSCKSFDVEIVKHCVEEFFGCDKMTVRLLTRKA